MTVPDTSENAVANLEWTDIRLPTPVFVGDTLSAETEILDKRESRSQPTLGIVAMRSRGINQHGQVVIELSACSVSASAPRRGGERVPGDRRRRDRLEQSVRELLQPPPDVAKGGLLDHLPH
jgi:hypothetical protein